MTREILLTDLELAARLRSSNRPDDEIILALVHRGIESTRAAQVLDDLKNGRKVQMQIPAGLEITTLHRSSRRSTRPARPSASGESSRTSSPRRHRSAESRAERRSSAVWIAVAIVVCAVVGAGSLVVAGGFDLAKLRAWLSGSLDTASARELASPDTKQTAARDAATGAGRPRETKAPAGPGRSAVPVQVTLDLLPAGLHIGGKPVTRATGLELLSAMLGAPSRTNQIGQGQTLVYAFDGAGLLIYSQTGEGIDSIVLDCDATGGASGTTMGFTGHLRVDGEVIRPETDSQTLASMRKLGLKNPSPNSSILGGRYNDLELVFAYLKSPQRLSLIEIDFK